MVVVMIVVIDGDSDVGGLTHMIVMVMKMVE